MGLVQAASSQQIRIPRFRHADHVKAHGEGIWIHYPGPLPRLRTLSSHMHTHTIANVEFMFLNS